VYVLAVPGTPPLFNSYSLPQPRRRHGRAAALSLLAHIGIAVLVLWRGATLMAGGGGGTGPRGGGGGGGPSVVTWFTLPAGSAPQAVDMPAAPTVVVPTMALPDPVKIDVPPLETISPPVAPPPPAVAGSGTGTTGGPGQGPGSGGGQGTGTGLGSGSDAGPGSGGEAGYILPATPRWALTPPQGAPAGVHGRPYQVRFWVTADGRVTRVEVTPPIKDAAYRRRFQEAMMGFRFTPAATRDGRRIDYVASVTVTP
jgi:periplasmic protein TonB